jgi:flagellar biogenesis protein FliO
MLMLYSMGDLFLLLAVIGACIWVIKRYTS